MIYVGAPLPMKTRSPPMKREATRGGRPAGALHSLCGHTVAAHEQRLIDQLLERVHRPGFVLAAFVATDGGPDAYVCDQ